MDRGCLVHSKLRGSAENKDDGRRAAATGAAAAGAAAVAAAAAAAAGSAYGAVPADERSTCSTASADSPTENIMAPSRAARAPPERARSRHRVKTAPRAAALRGGAPPRGPGAETTATRCVTPPTTLSPNLITPPKKLLATPRAPPWTSECVSRTS